MTEIESVGDHEYLIHLSTAAEAVTIRIRAHPDAITELLGAEVDGGQVVVATVDYLLSHQDPDELPSYLELRDVAAAYDDFPAKLAAALRQAAGS